MPSELVNILISAITSGIVTLLLEKRKERREDKKENEAEKKKIYENRPELQIIDFKENLKSPGYKIKKYDIDVFVTKIDKVSVENDTVTAHYNNKYFNDDEWCCVIYEFRNSGKTNIRCVSPICTYKKDTVLCDRSLAHYILEEGVLNYSTLYDKKICVGESFKMRVSYHKDCVLRGLFTANMVMIIEDDNGRFWEQPLFVLDEKIYDAYQITYKEYRDKYSTDMAIECFKKPWLWQG